MGCGSELRGRGRKQEELKETDRPTAASRQEGAQQEWQVIGRPQGGYGSRKCAPHGDSQRPLLTW